MALNELVDRNLIILDINTDRKMKARAKRCCYIDTKTIAEFGNPIGLVFPTTIREENIRDFLLMKALQCPGARGNGIRAEHEHTVNIEGKGIIQARLMSIAFPKGVHGPDRVPSIRSDFQH